MMDNKQEILAELQAEYDRWEALLAGLSEVQLATPLTPSYLSIKDVMAHLRAWQQRSIARLEAALHDHEPIFPKWSAEIDPEQDNADRINRWIFEINRDKPWPEVHLEWSEGFKQFIALSEAVPEKDLLQAGKYVWLDGYPLSMILVASYEHHHIDHYEWLCAWLTRHGYIKTSG